LLIINPLRLTLILERIEVSWNLPYSPNRHGKGLMQWIDKWVPTFKRVYAFSNGKVRLQPVVTSTASRK
jgi:hypothetical protein